MSIDFSETHIEANVWVNKSIGDKSIGDKSIEKSITTQQTEDSESNSIIYDEMDQNLVEKNEIPMTESKSINVQSQLSSETLKFYSTLLEYFLYQHLSVRIEILPILKKYKINPDSEEFKCFFTIAEKILEMKKYK